MSEWCSQMLPWQAGRQEKNTEAEWLASPLSCFCLTCWWWLVTSSNRSALTVVMTPKHFICHIWAAFWKFCGKECTSMAILYNSMPYPYTKSISKEVISCKCLRHFWFSSQERLSHPRSQTLQLTFEGVQMLQHPDEDAANNSVQARNFCVYEISIQRSQCTFL